MNELSCAQILVSHLLFTILFQSVKYLPLKNQALPQFPSKPFLFEIGTPDVCGSLLFVMFLQDLIDCRNYRILFHIRDYREIWISS